MFKTEPLKVKFASPFNASVVPVAVINLLSDWFATDTPDKPVKLDPSKAGNAPVNCADGKLVKLAPEPLNVVAVQTPVTTNPF